MPFYLCCLPSSGYSKAWSATDVQVSAFPGKEGGGFSGLTAAMAAVILYELMLERTYILPKEREWILRIQQEETQFSMKSQWDDILGRN